VIIVSRADFSPATLTIAVGSTVIWKNTSQVAHTVTSDDGTFDSGDLPAGATFRYTFTTPGTFHYTCAYHPWMTGTIIVQQK
jgi:plastocyanin